VVCGEDALADGILNLLLFVPFGWLVAGGPRNSSGSSPVIRKAVGWAAFLSLSIEVVQLLLPGRYSSLADIVANVSGAGIGSWVAARDRFPLGQVSGLAALALLAPTVLLAPRPTEGVLYGQWTPALGSMEVYEGKVLEAEVGGTPVPSRRVPKGDALREKLQEGAAVRVLLEVGSPPVGEAPIFSIFDGRQEENFMLGADGDDIFVRVRRIGAETRLRAPTWWWEAALSGGRGGDTLSIAFTLDRRAPCLEIGGGTRCLRSSASLGGWSLLAPARRGSLLLAVAGLLWAFLLGVPFGMLSFESRVGALWMFGPGILVAGLSSALPYWVEPWWGILLMLMGAFSARVAAPRRKGRM
jgi:hypothetical protein